MTFDRAEFEREMEELKKIPVLMNEEFELSKAMDEQEQDSDEHDVEDTA